MTTDPKPAPFRTLDDFAAHIGRSVKTARRAVQAAMNNDPGFKVTRVGRTILFNPQQWDRLLKALEWRPAHLDRARARTEPPRPARRAASFGSTAQEQLREELARRKAERRQR